MSSAYVQGQRGHIGIEAFVGRLSPLANRVRLWLVDLASLLFCAFFAWKSWTLTHEAFVDGHVSNSMWSPPLAIPYGLMATGMTLLCLQILLQIIIPLAGAPPRSPSFQLPSPTVSQPSFPFFQQSLSPSPSA